MVLRVLRHPTFARLYAAQVIALLGTGLMTVALALLAFDIAGSEAGAVLGIALAIKMVAYVGLAPVAGALTERLPRKAVLVGADFVRAAVALALPFVDAAWQVYVLIFVLQAASATFTPAFQALIPEVLPDEGDYTRALSLSRLAYDVENLASPALAGALLLAVSYSTLFVGTVAGFLGSAALVATAVLPRPATAGAARPFLDRLTRGARIYLATPRLRGLLAVSLATAAPGAFVIVNTVVLARVVYGLPEAAVAQALAAFGGGSMIAALALPRVLQHLSDRLVMLAAAGALAALTVALGMQLALAGPPPWAGLLGGWAASGACYAAALTPAGRLLRRSAAEPDRPALFAAQFALSHACWLATYLIAGPAARYLGLPATMAALGAVGGAATLAAAWLWPADDPETLPHRHDELPADHPHLARSAGVDGRGHAHRFVIDDLHPTWPR